MWDIIGAAILLGLGFSVVLALGIVLAHLAQRSWVMISGGYGWADAGALIRARYRRRHGAHRAGGGWEDTGMLDGDSPGPAYKPQAGVMDRLARLGKAARQPASAELTQALGSIAAAAQHPGLSLPVITRASGRPPWEDITHHIPVVPPEPAPHADPPRMPDAGCAETETFARPGPLYRRDLDDPGYGPEGTQLLRLPDDR